MPWCTRPCMQLGRRYVDALPGIRVPHQAVRGAHAPRWALRLGTIALPPGGPLGYVCLPGCILREYRVYNPVCRLAQDAVAKHWFRKGREPDGELDVEAVLAVAAEITAGMTYLHARGIVHGDLTGANILLTSNAVRPAGLEHWTAMVRVCKRFGRDSGSGK